MGPLWKLLPHYVIKCPLGRTLLDRQCWIKSFHKNLAFFLSFYERKLCFKERYTQSWVSRNCQIKGSHLADHSNSKNPPPSGTHDSPFLQKVIMRSRAWIWRRCCQASVDKDFQSWLSIDASFKVQHFTQVYIDWVRFWRERARVVVVWIQLQAKGEFSVAFFLVSFNFRRVGMKVNRA